MSCNKPGPRGSELHNAIVNWTRFDLIPYIRMVFPDVEWDCIYADGLMSHMLDTLGPTRSSYCPDGLWFYNGSSLIIEIGRFNLAKLPKAEQILHIGWDGQINIVNRKDDFMLDVIDAIEAFMIEYPLPSGYPPPTCGWG